MPPYVCQGTRTDASDSLCLLRVLPALLVYTVECFCRHFLKMPRNLLLALFQRRREISLPALFQKCHPNFLMALLEDASDYFFRFLILVPLNIFLSIFKLLYCLQTFKQSSSQAYNKLKKSNNV
jgi:hypothetical protein